MMNTMDEIIISYLNKNPDIEKEMFLKRIKKMQRYGKKISERIVTVFEDLLKEFMENEKKIKENINETLKNDEIKNEEIFEGIQENDEMTLRISQILNEKLHIKENIYQENEKKKVFEDIKNILNDVRKFFPSEDKTKLNIR